MIHVNSHGGNFVASIQASGSSSAGVFTGTLYKASKSIVDLSLASGVMQAVTNYIIDDGNEVTYVSDSSGHLSLSLKKWSEKSNGLLSLSIKAEFEGVLDYVTLLNVAVVEGIDYNDIIAPIGKDLGGAAGEYLYNIVAPPNIIINPTNGQGVRIETNINGYEWQDDEGDEIELEGERKNTLVVTNYIPSITMYDTKTDKTIRTWNLQQPVLGQCGGDLVCVRWTSQTGCVRQHYFHVTNLTKGVDGALSLVSDGDGYKVQKNVYNSFTARLEGLTAYSYWYYMDLLQASDAHAVIVLPFGSVFSEEIASDQTAVSVEGDSMTAPDGSGFFAFEVNIKYRHYDTF